jgi:hypothetical protein
VNVESGRKNINEEAHSQTSASALINVSSYWLRERERERARERERIQFNSILVYQCAMSTARWQIIETGQHK